MSIGIGGDIPAFDRGIVGGERGCQFALIRKADGNWLFFLGVEVDDWFGSLSSKIRSRGSLVADKAREIFLAF
jgi:hypothetical protein